MSALLCPHRGARAAARRQPCAGPPTRRPGTQPRRPHRWSPSPGSMGAHASWRTGRGSGSIAKPHAAAVAAATPSSVAMPTAVSPRATPTPVRTGAWPSALRSGAKGLPRENAWSWLPMKSGVPGCRKFGSRNFCSPAYKKVPPRKPRRMRMAHGCCCQLARTPGAGSEAGWGARARRDMEAEVSSALLQPGIKKI